jgi:regulator of protease activity HflC (stomatin/prohibitin superfamily)
MINKIKKGEIESMKKKIILPIILAIGVTTLSGCVKPYNKPKFVNVDANQTAFVIPLEGKTSEQAKFESVKYLEEMQVATKRIQIPRKWVQTGRHSWQGKYVDTVRVPLVDRTPVNRQWFNDATRSSDGKASGFIGESKDSIKFKIGLTATAKVEEFNTAKYLYQYRGSNLANIMDTEVRNKLGTILLEEYGSMSMEEIRSHKAEVIEHVRKVATPYFNDFGITLQNIGYVGDLEYVDPKVQEAINKSFNAIQAKEAQAIDNQKNLEKAQNDVKVAEQEAKAVEKRRSIINETIRLKELDNQAELIKVLPQVKLPAVMGGNGSILDLPESLLK